MRDSNERMAVITMLGKLSACLSILFLAACAAPPTSFVQPSAQGLPPSAVAQVFREFCVGGGRGLIHFESLDGTNVQHNQVATGGWPIKLVVMPGRHTVGVNYQAPDSSPFARWNGHTSLAHDFKAGKVYLLKYRRTSVDRYRAWFDILPLHGEVEATQVFCTYHDTFASARHSTY